MKIRIVLAGLLLGLLPAPLLAQAAPQQKAVSAKEAAIRRLLEITASKKLMDQMAAQIFGQVKAEMTKNFPQGTRTQQMTDAFFQKAQARFRGEELTEQFVAIYDKYFTKEDIEELIRFYQSPLGQRFLQIMPQIAAESVSMGMRWGQKVTGEIQKEMEAEFPELKQHKPRPSQPQP